ncbi:MAG: glycosyltransferase [Eubacterium sp.]
MKELKVLYNCIDLNVFNVNRKYNTEELKNEYGLNSDDFVYLYTGRVCPEKGILELVRAFKRIAKENKNAKLVVVGSRWYNLIAKDEYFKKLIEESRGYERQNCFYRICLSGRYAGNIYFRGCIGYSVYVGRTFWGCSS